MSLPHFLRRSSVTAWRQALRWSSEKLSLCLSIHPQKDCTFLHTPHPRANSSPVAGWSTSPNGQLPSSWTALGPTGHWGRESLLRLRNRTKSSWQGVQKWVVPKQKYTATEQQYLPKGTRQNIRKMWNVNRWRHTYYRVVRTTTNVISFTFVL